MRERLRQGAASSRAWHCSSVGAPVRSASGSAPRTSRSRTAQHGTLDCPRRDDFELLATWQRIRAELREEGVLVERLPFRPWRADADGESTLQVQTGHGPVPLTRLSSLVRALDTAWADELQVLAFADTASRASTPTGSTSPPAMAGATP